jgi:hypothetical protein
MARSGIMDDMISRILLAKLRTDGPGVRAVNCGTSRLDDEMEMRGKEMIKRENEERLFFPRHMTCYHLNRIMSLEGVSRFVNSGTVSDQDQDLRN